MNKFVKNASNTIRDFHLAMASRARTLGIAGAGMILLEDQIKVFEQESKRICDQTIEAINSRQKEVSTVTMLMCKHGLARLIPRCR